MHLRSTITKLTLRLAKPSELPDINAVISAAVMGWPLAGRVKRLALPSYLYKPEDLDTMTFLVAEQDHTVIAAATLETLPETDLPDALQGNGNARLLHGIYVHPDQQKQHIGHALWQLCADRAESDLHCGLMVRAQPQSVGFFANMGMKLLPVNDPSRDYAHRFWLPFDH